MPIVPSEVVRRFSTLAGSAGATLAGTASGSLGKFVSTTTWADGTALFDDVSATENSSNAVEYRCVFVENTHPTLTLQNAVVYLHDETAGGANIAIAVDNIGPVAKGSTSAQAALTGNDTVEPTGIGAFSSPTTAAAGLALGSLGPGQVRAVWVRRTATNSATLTNDGFTLGVAGNTAA